MSKKTIDSCTPKAHGAKPKAVIQVQAKQKGMRQTGGVRHIRSEKDDSAAARHRLSSSTVDSGGWRWGLGSERANSAGACLRVGSSGNRSVVASRAGYIWAERESTAAWKEAARVCAIFWLFFCLDLHCSLIPSFGRGSCFNPFGFRFSMPVLMFVQNSEALQGECWKAEQSSREWGKGSKFVGEVKHGLW